MQVNRAESIGYEMPKQNQNTKSGMAPETDWYTTMTGIMEKYMETEVEKKNEDLRELLYELGQYKPSVVMKGMEAMDESEDYSQMIKEKMDELFTKIKNGDTEPKYQIGAEEFTEEEWKEMLDRFDSVEDMIKELLKEKQKIEMEAAFADKQTEESA